MSGLEVPTPILNSPFAEPRQFWYIRYGQPPELQDGRPAIRSSGRGVTLSAPGAK